MKITLALLGASCAALSTAFAGEIRGKVTDAAGDLPLRGAVVTVQETGQQVTTERDGSYRITNLRPGTYTLVVDYVGVIPQTVTANLADADAVVVTNISLDSADLIVVRGQRGQLNSAIAQQRAADGIVTVLSADDIGQLPDENVAEAARRALGVSIANDQGEGRFISIRGINSQLNATSVNGVRLVSPEAGDRRIGLDVIDADVLKNIVINKTLSADMDGDAIGGSIELETLTGLDVTSPLFKARIGGIYSEITEETGPKLSASYAGNTMDGRLGIALSASFQNRDFGSDNKEVDGDWNLDDALPYVEEEFELREYEIERERLSLAANFDFMATDNTRLFFRSLYNEFSDQEFRSRTEVKIEDAVDARTFSGNTVFYSAGVDGSEFEVDRDIKDRLEEQRIWSLSTGFERNAGLWTIDGSVSFTHAEEEEPNRVDADFDQSFDEAGQIVGIDVSDLIEPQLVFPDDATRSAYLDASGYGLDAVEITDGITDDEEVALTFDVQRQMQFGKNPGFIKAGVKARLRDKSYDLDFRAFDFEGDATLAEFAREVDYPLDLFGPAPDAGTVRRFFAANGSNTSLFEFDADGSLEDSGVSSFEAEEDVLAGYVMGQVDIDRLRLTAGVRVEQTDVTATGNVFVEPADGDPFLEPITVEDDYTDVLPSIQARWNANDKTIVRASYYASIVRPNFAQFTPAGVANEDDGELEAGNPELERTKAQNFDLLVEYYPTESSILQGGIFYKDLEDLISSTTINVPGVFNGIAYNELSTFVNLDEGSIFGVEVGYQQALTMLPVPFDGLIAGLNYTYADSEATLPDGSETTVPGQSEHIFNAIMGYEKGRWNLRAAYSFKGDNLDDVDVDGVGEGRFVLDQSFLDLSAKYAVTENARLYIDLKNVLDTPLEAVNRDGGLDLANQYEEYGYTVQAGVLFNF